MVFLTNSIRTATKIRLNKYRHEYARILTADDLLNAPQGALGRLADLLTTNRHGRHFAVAELECLTLDSEGPHVAPGRRRTPAFETIPELLREIHIETPVLAGVATFVNLPRQLRYLLDIHHIDPKHLLSVWWKTGRRRRHMRFQHPPERKRRLDNSILQQMFLICSYK